MRLIYKIIETARAECPDPGFKKWAGAWLSGKDRSVTSALAMAGILEDKDLELLVYTRARIACMAATWEAEARRMHTENVKGD